MTTQVTTRESLRRLVWRKLARESNDGLTIAQAAEYLNVSPRTVREAISGGRIQIVEHSKAVIRIQPSELDRYTKCRTRCRKPPRKVQTNA